MHNRLGPQLYAEWFDGRIGGLWDFYCQSSLLHFCIAIDISLTLYNLTFNTYLQSEFPGYLNQNLDGIPFHTKLKAKPYSWHPKWTAETRDAVGCHEGIARAAASCLGRFRCHCQLHLPVNCGDMTGIPNNTNHQQKPWRVWDLMKIE